MAKSSRKQRVANYEATTKEHFKMYKKGKHWLVAGIAVLSFGTGVVTSSNVHADTNNNVIESSTEKSSSASVTATSTATSETAASSAASDSDNSGMARTGFSSAVTNSVAASAMSSGSVASKSSNTSNSGIASNTLGTSSMASQSSEVASGAPVSETNDSSQASDDSVTQSSSRLGAESASSEASDLTNESTGSADTPTTDTTITADQQKAINNLIALGKDNGIDLSNISESSLLAAAWDTKTNTVNSYYTDMLPLQPDFVLAALKGMDESNNLNAVQHTGYAVNPYNYTDKSAVTVDIGQGTITVNKLNGVSSTDEQYTSLANDDTITISDFSEITSAMVSNITQTDEKIVFTLTNEGLNLLTSGNFSAILAFQMVSADNTAGYVEVFGVTAPISVGVTGIADTAKNTEGIEETGTIGTNQLYYAVETALANDNLPQDDKWSSKTGSILLPNGTLAVNLKELSGFQIDLTKNKLIPTNSIPISSEFWTISQNSDGDYIATFTGTFYNNPNPVKPSEANNWHFGYTPVAAVGISYTGVPATVTVHYEDENGVAVATDEVLTQGTVYGTYKADAPTIPGYEIDTDTPTSGEITDPNQVVTIKYIADAQTSDVQYVDDDNNDVQVGALVPINGTTNETVNWNTSDSIPSGYQLAENQVANGTYTFGASDNANVVVHLVHVHTISNEKNTTDTVTYAGIDGVSLTSNSVTIQWTSDTDEVTKDVVWTSDASTTTIQTPIISGYSPDKSQVVFTNVTEKDGEPANQTQEVIYTATNHGYTVTPVDPTGKPITGTAPSQETGVTGQPVTVPNVPGYQVTAIPLIPDTDSEVKVVYVPISKNITQHKGNKPSSNFIKHSSTKANVAKKLAESRTLSQEKVERTAKVKRTGKSNSETSILPQTGEKETNIFVLIGYELLILLGLFGTLGKQRKQHNLK